MIASNPTADKFSITTRLFRLVGDMPKDQQLTLLRQLVGDTVSNYLYKLLKFFLPNRPQPITFAAKIVWSTTRDFGAKFDKASVLQNDVLKSFVEQKE